MLEPMYIIFESAISGGREVDTWRRFVSLYWVLIRSQIVKIRVFRYPDLSDVLNMEKFNVARRESDKKMRDLVGVFRTPRGIEISRLKVPVCISENGYFSPFETCIILVIKHCWNGY